MFLALIVYIIPQNAKEVKNNNGTTTKHAHAFITSCANFRNVPAPSGWGRVSLPHPAGGMSILDTPVLLVCHRHDLADAAFVSLFIGGQLGPFPAAFAQK